MSDCILCKSRLQKLLQIEHMPASAQNIPTKDELSKDTGITLHLCECMHCHLVQLDCEPVDYYKDVIRAGGYSTTMEQLRRAQYTEFIERCNLRGKKILEVGCGQGEFLSILASYPVQTFGIEHRTDLVELAKARGLQVWQDYQESETHTFANGPFDAFTSFNFLEHQPNPLMYLRAVHHNLNEEGYGLITVPSFEYILEHSGFYEIIRDHIAYYTQESLDYLLQAAGFEAIKKERVNRDTLSVIVRKRKNKEPSFNAKNFGLENFRETSLNDRDNKVEHMPTFSDVSGLLKVKQSIQSEIDALVECAKREKKTIAIWGASHQGFTLCSTTGLHEKVEYIIDSAPFKQGRFAPASHIPILSPDDAREHMPDIIIIVAPGYTEEIAGIIRSTFKPDMVIYTLMSDRLTLLYDGCIV